MKERNVEIDPVNAWWAIFSLLGLVLVVWRFLPRYAYYRRVRVRNVKNAYYYMAEERLVRQCIKLIGTSSACVAAVVNVWMPPSDEKRFIIVLSIFVINLCFSALVLVEEHYAPKIINARPKIKP